MKLGQALLINVAVVAAALVAYDQLRNDAPAPSQKRVAARSGVTDTAPLEKRVDRLEARFFASMKTDEGAEPGILERLDALEAALKVKPDPETGALPAMEREPAKASAKPTEKEVARFRELQEAVRREDRIRKSAEQVDRALDKLSVRLTPSQRKRVHAAFVDFQPQVNVIWGAIKMSARETRVAGGAIDRVALATQGHTQIQREFAAALSGIVHPADAEVVAAALHPVPDMGGKR